MHERVTLSTAGLFFTSLLSLVSLHAFTSVPPSQNHSASMTEVT